MEKKKEINHKEKKKTSKINRKGSKKIKRTTSEKILIGIFIGLLILVIILGIVCIMKKGKGESNTTANIKIPLIEENANDEIAINISNMKKDEEKEYVFQIINYKDNKINSQEMKYSIIWTTKEKVELKLYKNGEKKNLLKEKEFEVKDIVLKATKKQDDIYTLKIKAKENISANELLQMNIKSGLN